MSPPVRQPLEYCFQVAASLMFRLLDSSRWMGRPVWRRPFDQACTSGMSNEPTPSSLT
jgi:cytochrome c biogenesis protein ResB